jgi:hypothetical protein
MKTRGLSKFFKNYVDNQGKPKKESYSKLKYLIWNNFFASRAMALTYTIASRRDTTPILLIFNKPNLWNSVHPMEIFKFYQNTFTFFFINLW